jgi:opacity protein-like surface antigen
MKKFSILICIVLALMSFHGEALAQEFYLGIKFGLSSQIPKFEGEDIEYNVDTRTLYGFRLGLGTERVALEVSYHQADHFLEATTEVEEGLERLKLNFNWTGLNLLVFLPVPVVEPFLTGGYGTYGISLGDLDKDRSWGWNLGLGAAARVGGSLSLGIEGRYHRVKFALGERSLDLSDWTGNLSLNFHFDFMD